MEYIASQENLEAFVRRAASSSVLAIDTEFLREKTYYANLCLIQLATDAEVAVVDPFAIEDMKVLAPLLTDSSIVKLFHAGGQDLEILYRELGVLPGAPVRYPGGGHSFGPHPADRLRAFGAQPVRRELEEERLVHRLVAPAPFHLPAGIRCRRRDLSAEDVPHHGGEVGGEGASALARQRLRRHERSRLITRATPSSATSGSSAWASLRAGSSRRRGRWRAGAR